MKNIFTPMTKEDYRRAVGYKISNKKIVLYTAIWTLSCLIAGDMLTALADQFRNNFFLFLFFFLSWGLLFLKLSQLYMNKLFFNVLQGVLERIA